MTEAPTARYWRDHLRNAVQFAEGMARVAEQRRRSSSRSVLRLACWGWVAGANRNWKRRGCRRAEGQDDWSVVAGSVAEYYVRGGRIDWRGWDRSWQRTRVLLPNYPFQRSRHWFDIDMSRRVLRPVRLRLPAVAQAERTRASAVGSLAGDRVEQQLFESRLSMHSPTYLVDHQVQGSVVTPAAAYINRRSRGDEVFARSHGLANISIQQAMFFARRCAATGSSIGRARIGWRIDF